MRWKTGRFAILPFVLAITAVVLAMIPFPTWTYAAEPAPPPPPAVTAGAYVLMDQTTGAVLVAKNADEPRPPASLTKIMTALVALENEPLDGTVTVSANAARTGGAIFGMAPGDRDALWKLLYGLLFRSGNDAAVAIAESVSGSVPRFVELMNKKARALGARSTHFVNPHGLPARGHVSTARDLALIAREAMANPVFAQIVGRKERSFVWDGEPRLVSNINRFVWDYPGARGIKTGYTASAGFCLAAAAERDGRKLIAILLGSDSNSDRWAEARALMDYGFRNFSLLVKRARPSENVYIVRPGDTLWSIARCFGVSVERLAELNGLKNPDRVTAGQRLLVP